MIAQLLHAAGLLLTEEEREERAQRRAEEKARRELFKEQQKEIKYFSAKIPEWLAKMGYAYWYRKNEKDLISGAYNGIKIAEAHIGEDAYYLRVDTKRLPRGVMLWMLRDEKTLETLSAAAFSEVEWHQNESGCWYSIETKYGRGNIPAMVGYAEMLKQLPENAPPLAFPLGLGANQRQHFGDMETMINLLVGGTKGGGKSNVINVLLCTILARNDPRNLRVFLTDLKGGIEFSDYKGIPHLGGDVPCMEYTAIDNEGKKERRTKKTRTVPADYQPKETETLKPPPGRRIYTEPYEVLPMLRYVEGELDRRAKLLAGKAKKIGTYNKRYPDNSLSYWIIVIDELATLMEDNRYNHAATMSLAEVARKGRAVGIFLILATQTPSSAIVPQQIANNMDSRLAFRTGSGTASGVLLGSGEYDASRLPNIAGRFIWKWGGDKTIMQAPLIQDHTVNETVAKLKRGEYIDAKQVEIAQKAYHVFTVSLRKLKGECPTSRKNDIYNLVKEDGIKRSEVRQILKQYEFDGVGPEITIGENTLYLLPGDNPRNIPRCLVSVVDVENKKHPYDNYDFDLIPTRRAPNAKNQEITIPVDSEKPDTDIENIKNEILADLPFTPIDQPDNNDLGQLDDDELDWGSQWHYLDEEKPAPKPSKPTINLVDDDFTITLPSEPLPRQAPTAARGDFPLAVVLDAGNKKKWEAVKTALGASSDNQAIDNILDKIEV